jgi:hypothetical protein
MLVPVLLFGAVVYLATRGILEREKSEETGIVQIPVPPVPPVPQPQPAPAPVTPPPGWPTDGPSYESCESIVSALPQDDLKKLIAQIAAQTDAQWAESKAKMVALGQGQLANCLDSTRKFLKNAKW